jgi:hypothetical protein
MLKHLARFITAFLAVPILIGALYQFAYTIDLRDLSHTLLQLSVEQANYLLLVVVCLILLFELISIPLREIKLRRLLDYPRVRRDRTYPVWIVLHYIVTAGLVMTALVIPALHLFGSVHFSLSSEPVHLTSTLALLLLGTMYVTHLLEGQSADTTLIARLAASATVSVLDRKQDHNFMAEMLQELAPGSEIILTHFEEPRTPMHDQGAFGYYYERDFMEGWYATIRSKHLKVTQLLLINSEQDIEDLHKRLTLTQDIPTYQLAYLLAPPLTVFIEVMVVPGHYVKLGFSDDRSARNMNMFKLLLRSSDAISHFERLHREILIPEATFIKTFEGVRTEELKALRARANTIARTGSRVVREAFDFEAREE